MNADDILEIIKKDESLWSEFKEENIRSEQIGKQLSAFSNSEGGILLIGVTDELEISGVSNPKALMEKIANATVACMPPIAPKIGTVEMETGKLIVYVDIPHLTDVCLYKKDAYLRVGNISRKADGLELKILLDKKHTRNASTRLEHSFNEQDLKSKFELQQNAKKARRNDYFFLLILFAWMFIVVKTGPDYFIYTFGSGIALLSIIWGVSKLFNKNYISLHNQLPSEINTGVYLGGRNMLVNYSQDSYVISQPRAKCIETYCNGEIVLADRPDRERDGIKRSYVGKCTVAGWDHSYEIDYNLVAKRKDFDLGPIDQ